MRVTWTGKEALRSPVRMERTCTRWNLPGLRKFEEKIEKSFSGEIGFTQGEGKIVAHSQKLSKADHLRQKVAA